jgi:hypothetical protein
VGARQIHPLPGVKPKPPVLRGDFLLFDVPIRYAYRDAQQAPAKIISEETLGALDNEILFQKVREILGRPVTTVYRGQLRYIGVVQPPQNKVE